MEDYQDQTPRNLTKGDLFNYDNVPGHKPLISMISVRVCGFELVAYPPYSST